MDRYVVDASVIVASLLPDEPFREAALLLIEQFDARKLDLVSVDLLRFEVANALWKAAERGRVKRSFSLEAIQQFEDFGILYRDVPLSRILKLAHEYGRTAYDAAYLALAEQEGVPLVTADKRLYNALDGKFDLIAWIESVE
ncbi:type II toxin-antitoxin system VapC family toxin [Candidatus Bipolaricaulota bacterium]|nr:type II toxin-antitoxin system VapC family toxin [Candidatus Bipolaricaulota bacterium]